MYYDDGMGGVYTGYTSLPVYLGGSEQPMDLAGNPSTLIPGSGLSYSPKPDIFGTKYPQPALTPAVPVQPTGVVPGQQVTANPLGTNVMFENWKWPWESGFQNPIDNLGGKFMEGLMQIILMISMLKGGGNNMNQMLLMMMLMPQMFGGVQQGPPNPQTLASPFSSPLTMLALTNRSFAKMMPVLALGGLVPAGIAAIGALAGGMAARKRYNRKKIVYIQAPARRSYWRR